MLISLMLLLSTGASSHGFSPLLNRMLLSLDGVLLRFCLPGEVSLLGGYS